MSKANYHPEPIETEACSAEGWRVIAASVIGLLHSAAAGEREDAFAINIVEGCALAVVCDGAGSASRAAEGATAFSTGVLHELEQAAAQSNGLMSYDRFYKAIVDGVELCRVVLSQRSLPLTDYHATLVAIAVTPEHTLFAHVGDGLAGAASDGDWLQAAISRPENGEFSNETYFVTEAGWTERLRCAVLPALGINGAAVALTDGTMPFVIGEGQVGLEPTFMTPVSNYLRHEECNTAAKALAGTLDSADARRANSDDKTLVWIGRVAD